MLTYFYTIVHQSHFVLSKLLLHKKYKYKNCILGIKNVYPQLFSSLSLCGFVVVFTTISITIIYQVLSLFL